MENYSSKTIFFVCQCLFCKLLDIICTKNRKEEGEYFGVKVYRCRYVKDK